MRRIRVAPVVALVGCTSVSIAAPRPGAWQPYGPHENDAWVFDLATTKWSQHTSSVFTVVWQPSINAGVPGAPSKIPPPHGRSYNIVLNQMSMGPDRWGYSLAVHDFARDRWSDLTHLLHIPIGDGTIFWHQIGDRLVQLTVGCDPVPDTVEWRVEPTGLVISL